MNTINTQYWRMSNINKSMVTQEEITGVLENLTRMLDKSGYSRNQAREAVVSGVKGWKAKIRRRQEDVQDLYRSAASTLTTGNRKKLTAKTSWYKGKSQKRKYVMDEKEEEEMRSRHHAKRAKRPPDDRDQEREDEAKDKNKI